MSAKRTRRSTARTMEAAAGTSTQEHVDPPTATDDRNSDSDDSISELRRRNKRPKRPLTAEEEAKKRRVPVLFNQLNDKTIPAQPYRTTSIPQECQNCSKDFDDIVRQVHSDLKSGRIIMIDIMRKNTVSTDTYSIQVQTSECLAHCDGCQCHLPKDQRTPFQRDFAGGTTYQRYCKECRTDGKIIWPKSTQPQGQVTYSENASYRTRRSYSPCEDEALQDLHNHVLAGDQNVADKSFVKILDGLHGEGPCGKPCKLKADVVWMHENAPQEVGTQTNLIQNKSVQTDILDTSNNETQTDLQKSIGIQTGAGLALINNAIAPWHGTSIIQVSMPELPDTHRPVCKVVAVQSLI